MTGRRGGVIPAAVVVGWLRVDCGQQARGGRWVRFPAADYWCGYCGRIESASGDQVAGFVTRVRAAHASTCTARQGVAA